jgi:hypothetical protein
MIGPDEATALLEQIQKLPDHKRDKLFEDIERACGHTLEHMNTRDPLTLARTVAFFTPRYTKGN